MVYRLLYVSRVLTSQLAIEVEDILVHSMRNNARNGITGFLLCDGVNFAQALEGPRDKVEACFARIVDDDRHTRIEARLCGMTDHRRFGRWSMCALYLSDRDDQLMTPGEIDFNLERLAPGALWQHLAGLADRHGAELAAEHERLVKAPVGRPLSA